MSKKILAQKMKFKPLCMFFFSLQVQPSAENPSRPGSIPTTTASGSRTSPVIYHQAPTRMVFNNKLTSPLTPCAPGPLFVSAAVRTPTPPDPWDPKASVAWDPKPSGPWDPTPPEVVQSIFKCHLCGMELTYSGMISYNAIVLHMKVSHRDADVLFRNRSGFSQSAYSLLVEAFDKSRIQMPQGAEKDRFYDDWELKKRATVQQASENRGGSQPAAAAAVAPLYATIPKIPREAAKFLSDKESEAGSSREETAEGSVRF